MAAYLVTGGCGFIGSHLADAWRRRGAWRAGAGRPVHRRRGRRTCPRCATLLQGSVADAALVRAEAVEGIDGCFHLAAIASVQRSEEDLLGTHRTNLGGTLTLLDAIAAAGQPGAVRLRVLRRGVWRLPGVTDRGGRAQAAAIRLWRRQIRGRAARRRRHRARAASRPLGCGSSTCTARGSGRTRPIPASSRSSPTGSRAGWG